MEIQNYLQDGADMQARCVMCYLQGLLDSLHEIKIGRFENCREQGYCVYCERDGAQLNIIFFEHRNSDNICAVEWTEKPGSINTPTLDDIELRNTPWYENKLEVSKSVPFMHIKEMGDWIINEFDEFFGYGK